VFLCWICSLTGAQFELCCTVESADLTSVVTSAFVHVTSVLTALLFWQLSGEQKKSWVYCS